MSYPFCRYDLICRQYRDGLERMSPLWRYEEKVADLITELSTSAAQYRLSCENLLAPLMLKRAS